MHVILETDQNEQCDPHCLFEMTKASLLSNDSRYSLKRGDKFDRQTAVKNTFLNQHW